MEALILDGMTSAAFFDTMGKRIRILRDDRQLSQTDMAVLMGAYGAAVNPSYLSQIEADAKLPRLPVLRAIARVLETTTDYLLLLSDDPLPLVAQTEPDAGHGISEEAQEIAGLVDALPAWRRRELANWLRYVLSIGEETRSEARQTASEIQAQLAAAGYAMLTTPDTAAANAWWRRFVRVYVRNNQIVEVRWL